ncbi:hypothetical protein D3OALGB2SA_5061 [Olavius algarvensis associated proteobacterium Delta 3]|nr:hypothetical protein D3OALGB2SA_5061 [Olavius algarvensis associated proteobacterium Delta 3]
MTRGKGICPSPDVFSRAFIVIARIAFRFILRSTYHRKGAEIAKYQYYFAFR